MSFRIRPSLLVVCLILIVTAGCSPATIPPELELATQPSSNASSLTPQTKELSKKVNLPLTGAVFLATVATYWILMRYTPDLSHEIALPQKFLEDNISAVLSKTWLKQYMGPSTEAFPVDVKKLRWVLFRKGYTGAGPEHESLPVAKGAGVYEIQGYNQVPVWSLSEPVHPTTKRAIKIRTFSPVMRNLVQVAAWNSFSFWLVLAMVANTAVYNGLATNNLTQDGKLRLFLVGIYALANFLCQWYVSTQLYRNFTCTTFQTCWTLICNEFILLNGFQYPRNRSTAGHYLDDLLEEAPSEVWATLDLELFGKAERSHIYQLLFKGTDNVGSRVFLSDGSRKWTRWADNDKRRQSHLKARSAARIESDFDKFTKPVRDAELKAYEKYVETVLEKMLANVAALLGICLATALAPWTSTEKSDATTSQLGSYALLLTISTGLVTITSILGQLRNATESARTLLKLQERTIEVAATNTNDLSRGWIGKPPIMFSEGIENQLRVTQVGLWRQASPGHKLAFILFGPALMLIPRAHRICTDSAWLFFKVCGVEFTFRTDFKQSTSPSARFLARVPPRLESKH